MADVIGHFEQAVLVALIRLGEDAYGRAILNEIQARLNRDVSAGAVYSTLERLERKGFASSLLAPGTAIRGGQARRYYAPTGAVVRALNDAKSAADSLWEGLVWPLKVMRMNAEPNPPRWAEALLRSLLRPADRESIPGDLLEEYRVARHPALGSFRANLWYVKHVLSVLWQLIWPWTLAIAGLTPWSLAVSVVWHYSLVPAPAISVLHCMIYLSAGYFAARRTGLIRTGALAAGAISLIGFVLVFAFAAIRAPGLVLVPFSKPFIVVILSALLLIAMSHGVVIGLVAGFVGKRQSQWRRPARARSSNA